MIYYGRRVLLLNSKSQKARQDAKVGAERPSGGSTTARTLPICTPSYIIPQGGFIPAKGFMTRDFNKPKRDDSRPPFRNASPNRNRDERSPRPARPRLNRETVDRAWESGAQQQHADYRPRTGGGPARPQGQRTGGWNNTSNGQQSGGYSSQNGRGGSRPYNNNRQDNFRDNRPGNFRDDRDRRDSTPRNFDRPAANNNGPRPARPPYGQERRDFGGQRFENRRDSFNGPNRRDSDDRQQFQNRGNSRPDFGRNNRPSRNADQGQRENSNPRWQSRPGEQRNIARGPEHEFNRRPSSGERFEGDYEHFEERDTRPARPTERPFEARPPRPAGRPFEGRDARDNRPARPTQRPFEERDSRDARPSRPAGRTFEDRDTRDARPPRPAGRPFSGSRRSHKVVQNVDLMIKRAKCSQNAMLHVFLMVVSSKVHDLYNAKMHSSGQVSQTTRVNLLVV